jgi:hypothetical protein
MEQKSIETKSKNNWQFGYSKLSSLSLLIFIILYFSPNTIFNNFSSSQLFIVQTMIVISLAAFLGFGLMFLISNYKNLSNNINDSSRGNKEIIRGEVQKGKGLFRKMFTMSKFLASTFPGNFFFFISLLVLFIGICFIVIIVNFRFSMIGVEFPSLAGLAMIGPFVITFLSLFIFVVFFWWSFLLRGLKLKDLLKKETSAIKGFFGFFSIIAVLVISYGLITFSISIFNHGLREAINMLIP